MGMSAHMKVKKGRPMVGWPGGNTPPVIAITPGFDAAPSIAANPNTSFFAVATDAQQGDISANIVWSIVSAFAVPATSGFADALVFGAPTGATIPAIPTNTYDLDVTFETGGLQQLAVSVNVADSYDVIAATISGLLANGACAFVSGAFRVTSTLTGVTSTAAIADGTTGTPSAGGDFFVAVDAAAGGATTFPTPTVGTDLVPEVRVTGGTGGNPSISFLVQGAQDVIASITDGYGATVTDTESVTVGA